MLDCTYTQWCFELNANISALNMDVIKGDSSSNNTSKVCNYSAVIQV